MMYVAICDDNKSMLVLLNGKIGEILSENEMPCGISTFLSGTDFLESHKKQPFDVVFLDIVMPEIDGFKVAKQVREISKDTYIIFITTESSLVYDSFDYQPFYFIPKGKLEILNAKLKSVIGKLIEQIGENYTLCLELPHGEKKIIETDSIIYIGSESNYLDIVCQTETIYIRRKLNDMMNELPPKTFARIHNRFAVNMRYVGRIDNSRCKVILSDETELDISRAYKADFVEKYNIYLRNFA